MKAKKILFISHDATRTGAPIVLLNFLRWLKKEGTHDFEIFLKNSGPLKDEFKEVAFTYMPIFKGLVKRFLADVLNKFSPRKEVYKLPSKLKKQKFDLVVINTVDCLNLAPLLKETFNCNIICHVHENSFTIKNYYPESVDAVNLQNVDHFIAVSESTGNNLTKSYGISKEKISLVNECISLQQIQNVSVLADVIRQELGLTNEFIVGGSGLTTWRKGVDLFVRLAIELDKLKPDNNIKLVWVGNIWQEFKNQFEYESERLTLLKDKVIFTGVKPQVQNYFQIFEVFALTSREDPFPLVALEAAAQKKPIICFENTGGIPELVKNNNGGLIVPYGDVTAMAQQILLLSEQHNKLASLGERAENIVQQFDVNVIGKQLVNVIERF